MIKKNIAIILVAVFFLITITATPVFGASPSVPSTFYVGLGGSRKISADISRCKGTNKKWSTESDNISITSSGTVQGLNMGRGVANCTTNAGEIASCTVIVVPAAKVTVNKKSISLVEGSSESISASVSPSNAVHDVSWSSSSSSVATVSGGRVYAHSSGSCVIYCVSQDGTGSRASCSVTVSAKKVHTTKRKAQKKKTTTKRKVVTTKKITTTSRTTKNTTTTRVRVFEDIEPYHDNDDYEQPFIDEPTTKKKKTTTTTTAPTTTTKKYVRGGEVTTSTTKPINTTERPLSNDVDSSEFELFAISEKNMPVVIQWNEIEGAEGYELYCFKKLNNNSKTLIYDGVNNEYKLHFYRNGAYYYFVVRSYTYQNNKKIYSDYSPIIKIRTVKKPLFTFKG